MGVEFFCSKFNESELTMKYKEFSTKVNSLTLNTVENILEIGRLMLECKDSLEPDEYKLFLKETSYKEETPTVRKWNRIGDSYVRLKSISQYLPPVVSTLYKLSTLDSNKLNKSSRRYPFGSFSILVKQKDCRTTGNRNWKISFQ